MGDDLSDFGVSEVTYLDQTKTTYRKGAGPAVVVISEIPGITPLVADFARRVVDLGCTVAMPVLFGTPGQDPTIPYTLGSMTKACVSSEFHAFATHEASPVTKWLREYGRDLHEECGGPGIGAIGMCLTGGFALAMMVDDFVAAPVLSQPSLPFPVGKKRKRALGISDDDLKVVKERTAAGCSVLGLRFTNDSIVPAERFARLREELGDGFVGVEIDSSKGNPYGNKTTAHSVVTEDLVDEEGHPTHDALNQVLDLFRDRLLT